MNILGHPLFLILVVWIVLSFFPKLLLTNFVGRGRTAGASR